MWGRRTPATVARRPPERETVVRTFPGGWDHVEHVPQWVYLVGRSLQSLGCTLAHERRLEGSAARTLVCWGAGVPLTATFHFFPPPDELWQLEVGVAPPGGSGFTLAAVAEWLGIPCPDPERDPEGATRLLHRAIEQARTRWPMELLAELAAAAHRAEPQSLPLGATPPRRPGA
jgi:hypothetical protein